jgi:hypothetical protein
MCRRHHNLPLVSASPAWVETGVSTYVARSRGGTKGREFWEILGERVGANPFLDPTQINVCTK